MDVTIVYSLPTRHSRALGYTAADEDTGLSAKLIYTTLRPFMNVSLFPLNEDHIEEIRLVTGDIIINLIEWDGNDLDLSLKAMRIMDACGIHYAGATIGNFRTTADKLLMKTAFKKFHIPTATWQVFKSGNETVKDTIRYPSIVKVTKTHCSVGLDSGAVVHNRDEARKRIRDSISVYKQPVLLEEFIDGREFQVTLLETAKGLEVLPPAEISFRKKNPVTFLTYGSRWETHHPDYQNSTIARANLESGLYELLRTSCIDAYRKLHFRDYARFDIRVRRENGTNAIYFLETNCNPGIDDDKENGLAIAYRAAGMTLADFMKAIIENAAGRRTTTHHGVKTIA
jgi:D-alanine-D-alanine ligase